MTEQTSEPDKELEIFWDDGNERDENGETVVEWIVRKIFGGSDDDDDGQPG